MIMTYQEANSISIKDYLESLGILPVVDKLYYGMYHSPLRQDAQFEGGLRRKPLVRLWNG